MGMQVLLFLISSAVILLGSHLLLGYSLIRFFNITNPTARYGLVIVILLFTASFVVASALVRFQENIFSKTLYRVSAVWLGLLVNLLLACAAVWFLRLIFINNKALTIILFAAAALYSVYGVWNAFHPQVKKIDVTIKNLPQVWQGKTIVQLSDVHIGAVHGQDFLKQIVYQVNALNPEMVVITGDLFDGMDGAEGLPSVINDINAPRGVYFITGNHETYFGLDKAFNILKQTKIKILDDKTVDLDGLQIVGVSYPNDRSFNEARDLKKVSSSMDNFVAGKPTILLYHSPMPSIIKQAKELGVNLQLSGHTHAGQIFPFGFITKILYDGYDYGLRTDGDYNIYTSNGVGTWGPPMRTGNTPEIVAVTLK